ncbi:MAG: helix-turn-helix domain-containing protein [Promethearchaeota archaeon]|jgi:predicted transcriptional regulator
MYLDELQSLLKIPELGVTDLMRCTLGVKTTEIEAYCILSNHGSLSTKDAVDLIKRSRPTVQRILQGLVEKGLATREQELIGLGGYRYIYSAVPAEVLKDSIIDKLEKWYERMLNDLEDFPNKIKELRCSN